MLEQYKYLVEYTKRSQINRVILDTLDEAEKFRHVKMVEGWHVYIEKIKYQRSITSC